MKSRVGKLFLLCVVSVLTRMDASATVLYVNPSSSSPTWPYSNWGTAAHDIQSAVNTANAGDEVLVTNGVYNTGQSYLNGSNRVTVVNPILVESLNGPGVTIIQGYQVPRTTNGAGSVRCIYLGNGAQLAGFTLTNGSASTLGGGVYCQSSNVIVFNCIITQNACPSEGGGGFQGAYDDCKILGNIAYNGSGGGVYDGYLTNCLVAGNLALNGGGLYQPLTVVNCTVINNSAGQLGGGAFMGSGSFAGQLFNSILYFNNASTAAAPHGTNIYQFASITVSNCCSTDLTNSTSITNLPGLLDVAHGDYRLQVGSPCIDAGNNSFLSESLDVAGNPRIFNGTVDMGAYENEFAGTAHFVSLASTNPVSPFTNWLTAATVIQAAIDAADPGDLVVVSNGTYQTGGRVVYGTVTNLVAVDRPITVASLNGPVFTLLAGYRGAGASANRCAYLANNACLIGFTLTNGFVNASSGDLYTNRSGGGAWCETTNAILYNCILTHNQSIVYGGGAVSGTLTNCLIAGNTVIDYGGGTAFSVLENCMVSSNRANLYGGGALGGVVIDSTLISNHVINRGGGVASNVVINCLFLTNMSDQYGGGAFASVLTNCTLVGNNATFYGGASFSNTLYNCVLYGNSASNGGAMYYGSGVGCLMVSNSSLYGEASAYANLTNCTLYLNNQSVSISSSAINGGIAFNCIISNNTVGVVSNQAYGCLIISNTSGGSYFSTLNNCSLIGNGTGSPGIDRGGSYGDILNNCLVTGNLGMGAYLSTLNNCTVIWNHDPTMYAGVTDCQATNCIIYFNNSANYFASTLSYCCTYPAVPSGEGSNNLTNPPQFLDIYHLSSNSPCIDTGYNPAAVGTADLDGRPRIVNNMVDMGASEFQGASMEPLIAWLAQYDLPDDGSADYVDSDGTGLNNWQKWIAGLNPTNPASVLAMSSLSNTISGTTVMWQSVSGITYYVQCSTNLLGVPAFTSIQSNIVGQAATTSYTDPTATNGGNYFYRVGVQY